MLRFLSIRHLAVIDELEIDFDAGRTKERAIEGFKALKGWTRRGAGRLVCVGRGGAQLRVDLRVAGLK